MKGGVSMDIYEIIHKRIAENNGSEYVKNILESRQDEKLSEAMSYLWNKEGRNANSDN